MFLKADWKKDLVMDTPLLPSMHAWETRTRPFEWRDKAYAAHSQDLTFSLLVEPAFDSLRSDPRFEDLLHRMGRTTADRKPD
jgi:hypothetical protein